MAGVKNTYLSWRKRGMLFTSLMALAIMTSDWVKLIGLNPSHLTFPMMLWHYCLIIFNRDSTTFSCCPPVGVWVWIKDIKCFSWLSTIILGLIFFGIKWVPLSETISLILPNRYWSNKSAIVNDFNVLLNKSFIQTKPVCLHITIKNGYFLWFPPVSKLAMMKFDLQRSRQRGALLASSGCHCH